MRRAALAASVVAGALVLPGTAAAHLRTGRVAVDDVASVAPLREPLAGAVRVRVYKADLALGLTLLGRPRIIVLGYSGEPFLRFGPDGAYADRSSLTAVGLGLVAKGSGWHLLSRESRLIWHDARVRGLPEGARRGRWAVPLVVDGTRTELAGDLRRERRPPVWPWLAIGAAFAVATGLILAARRQGALRTAAAGLGWVAALATLLVTCGFAAAPTASSGTWVEAGNEILFVLVGIGFLVAGSRAHARSRAARSDCWRSPSG